MWLIKKKENTLQNNRDSEGNREIVEVVLREFDRLVLIMLKFAIKGHILSANCTLVFHLISFTSFEQGRQAPS